MTKVVGVPGTWGRGGGWWQDGSPLWLYLSTLGIEPARLNGRPYEWDTELDPISWLYAGKALAYYLAALPYGDANVIAYSFGAQPVFHAASEGASIRRLLTVGSPVRDESLLLRERARQNIDRWWHVMDEDADAMAILGAFDGIIGPIERRMPEADVNIGIVGIGHGGILSNPALFCLWQEQSLAAFLRGEGYERAA